ncbi:MAG: hypothetical protein GY763_08085 [Gammaproteobacteria bacterium]|nr:hypothetical protein [Gammaproteobacteria bacterium]
MSNGYPNKLKLPIFVVIVLAALGGYFLIMQLATSEIETPTSKTQKPTKRLESVNVLISRLKQRLETQKDDVNGWILLSKSYYHLNRLEEADQAFGKAIALGYAGNWKPLPRIDSFMHLESSTQKLKELANFRDNKIDLVK